MKRQAKVANYMDIAKVCANRSHDSETKVGAVLVNNKSGAVLATGYNGFVRGADDGNLPNLRPEKYEYILHAEQNLISNCSRHGISMEDCTLVCTHSPCKLCMRMLFNCGITEVIVETLYTDFEQIIKMDDLRVVSAPHQDGYIRLSYFIK
jgi:dCMP deaminase